MSAEARLRGLDRANSYLAKRLLEKSSGLLLPACTLLEEKGWLASEAWVYTESENPPSSLGLPGNWRLHREQKAGQVYYALWERSAAA